MRLNNQQKFAGIVVIALFLAIMIGGFLWAREPAYAVLFSIQDEKDGGQIVAALQQQNIPYHFSEGGRTILVPQNVVHDTRLRLAAQGLPKGGLVGFELLENQKMGISQFAEQVNYQRGLEGELARSIQSLAAVKGARVHLGIPKQTAFLRDEQKTSASVLVSLYPGRTLESSQVAGIVNLVASSVPQLNPLNVTVIDQEGRLISQSQDSLRNAGLDPSQLKYVREIEANYTKRIEDILSPVVGASNVRAQALLGLLKVINRARQAAHWARHWAILRRDVDVEEITLAAFLHDLAELLMWLFAPTLALKISAAQRARPHERSAIIQAEIYGVPLYQLKLALAEAWHLPALLIQLMDHRHTENPRVRNVKLAVDLARHSAKGWSDAALPDDFAAIRGLLNINQETLVRHLDVNSATAQALLTLDKPAA